MNQENIRNFVIIAHIDHGKSTLADRFLEITKTVPKEEMRSQYLDQMDLERERGITIKLQPVRMQWHPTRINADKNISADQRGLLYEDLTYKIRGAIFNVYNQLGSAFKENIYQRALKEEFSKANLSFEEEKIIDISYNDKKVGIYKPDFIIENKVILEIKALPFLGHLEKKQTWYYLKGSQYKLALLANFGSQQLQIERMVYDSIRENPLKNPRESAQVKDYVLNLIDTPGHVDFSYEVSRSLAAVEGAILVVDATQGIQAQTLANLHQAQAQNLVIIPVINKIDLPNAEVEKTAAEISKLLGIDQKEIIKVSAKTGQNVEKILDRIVEFIPPPKSENPDLDRALIFDSVFDEYRGVIAYVRVVDGEFRKDDKIRLLGAGVEDEILEVGYFSPEYKKKEELTAGEIGYIVTGLKDISKCRVGDTIAKAISDQRSAISDQSLEGYHEPQPMVFASIYTLDGQINKLRDALGKLKLNDASLYFEPENSKAFGYGFRCGFLGLLHLEIVKERLEREYGLELLITTPRVDYKLITSGREKICEEPWVILEIISPQSFIGQVMELVHKHRGRQKDVNYIGDRVILKYEAPLAEIIIGFYDKLKSISQGYASMNYELIGWRPGDLVKMDILIAQEKIEALSQIVHRSKLQHIARTIVKRLKELIPRQWFEVSIQAAVGGSSTSLGPGKIIARENISALKKDVTGHLYGGDITRKKKLWAKQAKGKKKMKKLGKVDIPTDVFIKLLKT